MIEQAGPAPPHPENVPLADEPVPPDDAAAPPESAVPAIPAVPVEIRPVESAERIAELDILRGFAIFGIFMVNLQMFNTPMTLPQVDPAYWPAGLDRAVNFLVSFLFQGKFYTLFSFLFGLGIAIQVVRTGERGAAFRPLILRRLLALLGIGLLHAFLFWYGDILSTYAFLGFFLLLLRKRSDRALWIWAGVLFVLPLLLHLVWVGLTWSGAIPDMQAEILKGMRVNVMEALETYPHGSWGEIFRQRAGDFGGVWSGIVFFGPNILALFILGLLAGRHRLFHEAGARREFFRRVRNWAALPGFGLSLAGAWLALDHPPHLPTWPAHAGVCCSLLGNLALSCFYVSTVVLLCQKEAWRRWLAHLAPVGRTALSNYLLQTMVVTTLVYSYGLGLYGRFRPVLGFLFVSMFYFLQIQLSRWWLARCRFGPAEWLWRSLTYWRRQPLRIRPAVQD